MSSYYKGDIVLIRFPFTDLSGTKLRPAIVISGSQINITTDVVLAQLSGTLRGDKFAFQVTSKDVSRPLDGPSEIRCHKIFTASKDKIIQKISSLNAKKQEELLQKIVTFLQ